MSNRYQGSGQTASALQASGLTCRLLAPGVTTDYETLNDSKHKLLISFWSQGTKVSHLAEWRCLWRLHGKSCFWAFLGLEAATSLTRGPSSLS